MTNITQDDLLQFLYNEGSPEKREYIEEQLEIDAELLERFNVLKSSKNRLDKVKLISPDDRSVDNIFNYSQQGVVEIHVTL
jgi:hypothetical protein